MIEAMRGKEIGKYCGMEICQQIFLHWVIINFKVLKVIDTDN